MTDLPKDLVEAIAKGRALIVCGAGISRLATRDKAPGWKQLIEMGLEHATPRNTKNPPWVKACRMLLKSASTEDWLYAADIVQDQLGGPTGGRYCDFLRGAVGDLKCENHAVMDALNSLARIGNRIATTNFDGLLVEGLGRERVVWTDTKNAADCLVGSYRAIFHLHGHWRESPSVVFSRLDYERLRNDANAQFLQHHASFDMLLVFAGCSTSGLADENVGALLQWFGTNWSGLGKTHYALVRKADLASKWPDAVSPLAYGNKYSELTTFLEMLVPFGAATSAKPSVVSKGYTLATKISTPLRSKTKSRRAPT
jgi:hypothetical protein